MPDANDRTAATPPFEGVKPTIPAIDYNTPPLAAVTGVAKLRNGEEVPGRKDPDGTWCEHDEKERGWRRRWATASSYHLDGSRHPEDIVAQVSVGPTGPGVYALDGDGRIHLTGKDERGWRVHAKDPWYRDEFGRCFDNYGTRYATGDLRRRIGDLPEAEGIDGTNWNEQWICSGCGELGPGMDGAWRWTGTAWEHACEGRVPQAGHYACELLANVLRSGPDAVPAVPASPSYPASDGRAAMDAMCPPEPPERFPETRRFNGWELAVGPLWYARVLENVERSKTVVMMVDADGNATLECVKGMPGELAVVRRDSIHVGMVPVPRDDLRVLYQGLCDAANMSGHFNEADFGTLSRAAAALGDVEVPDWMREHARKEGWTCS